MVEHQNLTPRSEPSEQISQINSKFYMERQRHKTHTCVAHSINAVLGEHAVCPNDIVPLMMRADLPGKIAGLNLFFVNTWLEANHHLSIVYVSEQKVPLNNLVRLIQPYTRVLVGITLDDSPYAHAVAFVRTNAVGGWHVIDSLQVKPYNLTAYVRLKSENDPTFWDRVTMQLSLVVVLGGPLYNRFARIYEDDDEDLQEIEVETLIPVRKKDVPYPTSLICSQCGDPRRSKPKRPRDEVEVSD